MIDEGIGGIVKYFGMLFMEKQQIALLNLI